jgi:hypothetical protein
MAILLGFGIWIRTSIYTPYLSLKMNFQEYAICDILSLLLMQEEKLVNVIIRKRKHTETLTHATTNIL